MTKFFMAIFLCWTCFASTGFASMGRLGGWTTLKVKGSPSSEQKKNTRFAEVDDPGDVTDKPRANLTGQTRVNTGVIYTLEDKEDLLPPTRFEEENLYADAFKKEDKGFKSKAIRPIDGLNITESGTYIAD